MAEVTIPLVQSDPLAMTDAELVALFGPMQQATLMRALILYETRAIEAGAVTRERRTMRNMWYDQIKPVLSRSGRLRDVTTPRRGGKPQPVDWDGLLSRYLAEMVRDGLTSYELLEIVDDSRQRQPAQERVRNLAGVRLVGAHYPWVILFTEKDTMWGEVEAVAALYGVSAISGGGQPAAACTADVVRQIQSAGEYSGQDLILLSLTDYDPAGYSIAQSQEKQLREAVDGECDVYHARLGLRPDQLSPEDRAAKAYAPPRDKLFREWYAETRGVDGQPLGLELDALGLDAVREMFAYGIERHVDLTPRWYDLQAAAVELAVWEVLRPEVERRKAALIAQVESAGVWDRILETDPPDGLFTAAARAGFSSLDPLAQTYRRAPLFDCLDDLRAVLAPHGTA